MTASDMLSVSPPTRSKLPIDGRLLWPGADPSVLKNLRPRFSSVLKCVFTFVRSPPRIAERDLRSLVICCWLGFKLTVHFPKMQIWHCIEMIKKVLVCPSILTLEKRILFVNPEARPGRGSSLALDVEIDPLNERACTFSSCLTCFLAMNQMRWKWWLSLCRFTSNIGRNKGGPNLFLKCRKRLTGVAFRWQNLHPCRPTRRRPRRRRCPVSYWP